MLDFSSDFRVNVDMGYSISRFKHDMKIKIEYEPTTTLEKSGSKMIGSNIPVINA